MTPVPGASSTLSRRRRWFAGWSCAAMLVLATRVPAQVLDLDAAPAFPETPVSVLDEIAERLSRNIAASDGETDADVVRAAGATLRRVIAELASRGRGTSPGAAAAGLAALRLAPSIEGIERRLEPLSRPGAFTGSPPLRLEEDARRRGLDRLIAFNRAGLDELRRRSTESLVEFDDTIALVLAPVVDALEIVERRPLDQRWPAVAEVRSGGIAIARAALPPLPAGAEFLEIDQRLRARTADDRRRVHRVFRETADRASRLNAEGPGAASAIAALLAVAELQDDDAMVRAVERMDVATRIASDLERLGQTPAGRDTDPEMLASLLSATLERGDDPRTVALLRRQAQVTSLILAGTRLDIEELDRDLRAASIAVQKRHRRLVRSTVDLLVKVGSDPAALGDPAAVGALQGLEASIADLGRLGTADRLAARLTAIRPGAAREFRTRIRAWCQMLGKDATQAEGAAAIDLVSSDLDQFMPFPAEAWLASDSPSVTERTGGRSRDLLDRATETRRRWADEISNGDLGGPARLEMERLARLGAALDGLDAILAGGDDDLARGLKACDRWGGWFVPANRLEWTARTLAPTLRLAVASGADGDVPKLDRDLARLESAAPPAAVVAWLAARVGPALEAASADSTAAVAAVALPPDRDAWGQDHRETLARICRGFAEIDAAQRRGDRQLVERMTTWVVESCDDLLDRVRAAGDDRPLIGRP